MFMDQEIQRHVDVHSPQSDLQTQSPSEHPESSAVGTDKLVLKQMWRSKGTRTARVTLRKDDAGGAVLPNVKSYYKARWSRQCGRRKDLDSMAQDTEPRNKGTRVWPTDLWQRGTDGSTEKDDPKQWATRSRRTVPHTSHTLPRNLLIKDRRPPCEV